MGGWLLVAHVSAALLLPWLPLNPYLQFALGAALLVNLLRSWWQYVLRTSRHSVCRFTWQRGQRCRVQLAGGAEFDAELGTRAFVQPWLVILQYRISRWRSHYLLLLPDMLDATSWRQLRVRLRMELSSAPVSER